MLDYLGRAEQKRANAGEDASEKLLKKISKELDMRLTESKME